MKYFILLIAFLMLSQVLLAKQTYVPDDRFEQALIDLGYDVGPLNDSVPTASIETVTLLDIRNKNISDITGIEDFSALILLVCSFNNLTSLDVSNSPALVHLNCSKNNLTSLDVSNNSALTELSCHYNNLTSLDLSINTALDNLNCSENNLTSLDVSNSTALVQLNCSKNNLTSINVSNNSALKTFYCHENNLTNLDVSNNTALEYLSCFINNLTSLDLSNNTALRVLSCSKNDLTSLDMSNNTALRVLSCFENNLTSLDIKNGNNRNMIGEVLQDGLDATGNPDLYCIQVDDSMWSSNQEKWKKDAHAVYSEDCSTVGVEDFNYLITDVDVFPNPVENSFVVSFKLNAPQNVIMKLTDLSSKEIKKFTLDNIQFINEIIDVSGLSAGIYYLKISFGSENISRKIVVE